MWFQQYQKNAKQQYLLQKNIYFPAIYTMNGNIRANIESGMRVKIVLKKDQRSGMLTEGIVKRILTSSPNHPHGIKVLLEDGQVGRVKEILADDE
jgi:uncharacterized repeat protein (TIGR03833 family)